MAEFTVVAGGSDITYLWVRDDMTVTNIAGRITGGTNSTLTFLNVTEDDFGEYYCIVSNLITFVRTDRVMLQLRKYV